jgi:hypothetical protein
MNRFTLVLEARFKSFLWRAGSFLAVGFLTWLVNDVANWGLSLEVQSVIVGFLGLLSGEVTKYFNSNREWVKNE